MSMRTGSATLSRLGRRGLRQPNVTIGIGFCVRASFFGDVQIGWPTRKEMLGIPLSFA